MKLKVEQCNRQITEKYPYTHRIECEHLADYFQILNWINANKMRVCAIDPSKTVYLNAEDTEWLLLRWS